MGGRSTDPVGHGIKTKIGQRSPRGAGNVGVLGVDLNAGLWNVQPIDEAVLVSIRITDLQPDRLLQVMDQLASFILRKIEPMVNPDRHEGRILSTNRRRDL